MLASRFERCSRAVSDEALRYPIGRYSWDGPSADRRHADIEAIAALPEQLGAAVQHLSVEQLETPYRPGGWTVRQVVHHLGDSHLNAFARFKLALTEEQPTIRPYDQATWAKLADYQQTPIEISLSLLEALHGRWVILLESLSEEDFERTFIHPEMEGARTLDFLLGMYGWHSRHHLAHVTSLIERMGW